MFKLAVLAAALAAAPVVFGQSTTAVPECISNCITTAAPQSGCADPTDVSCLCQSDEFQTAAAACITQNCPDLLAQAIELQTAQCAAAGTETGTETGSVPPPTGSASGTASTTRSGNASASTSRPVSSAVSSASAAATSSRPNAGFESASIASGAAIALFGAALSLF
ncbi:hypothetical protein FRC17_002110 [Serendipita sp. 399]|nr:hypothetical protein FRC17_002110 [Serendipita sp. 399]